MGMVMDLESFRVDGAGYDDSSMRPRPSRKFDKPEVKIMFQVTQIVRFLRLLEGGLRFRNLGFCGHGLM